MVQRGCDQLMGILLIGWTVNFSHLVVVSISAKQLKDTVVCIPPPFFFKLHHEPCGILVSRPGIKLVLPELGARSLNHWTAREVHVYPLMGNQDLAARLHYCFF